MNVTMCILKVDYGEDEDNYEEEGGDDAEEMMRRMQAMDEELENLDKASASVEDKLSAAGGNSSSSTEAVDECSIYIGQVDYEATAEELRAHFSSCGVINRVTIATDKWGSAKGFGYIEFAEKDSVDKALLLDDTPFKGRQLKVIRKRQNLSAVARGVVPAGRGRGGRGGRGFSGRSFGGRFGGRGGGRGGRGGRFSGRGRGGRGRWNDTSHY